MWPLAPGGPAFTSNPSNLRQTDRESDEEEEERGKEQAKTGERELLNSFHLMKADSEHTTGRPTV